MKAANDKNKDGEDGEPVLYSDEYYAAQKAKRQGLGLIEFIGELFKLQMLTERIMHGCIKKLFGNVENPEEEEIESLCKLLTTVGKILDTSKARAHMDVYFSRMKELTRSGNVSSRMQFMLQVYISFPLNILVGLYFHYRISLSSVIANGLLVILLQLHQRSLKFTKWYAFFINRHTTHFLTPSLF